MQTVEGYSNYIITINGDIYNKHGRQMKSRVNKYGYKLINLVNDAGIRKAVAVHRLVALTYLNKIVSKPIVNHINGDKQDNRVSNLEWCTYRENTLHAQSIGKMPKATVKVATRYEPGKPVQCSNGKVYKSLQAAVEAGDATSARGIYSVIKGEQKTHNGYGWSRA